MSLTEKQLIINDFSLPMDICRVIKDFCFKKLSTRDKIYARNRRTLIQQVNAYRRRQGTTFIVFSHPSGWISKNNRTLEIHVCNVCGDYKKHRLVHKKNIPTNIQCFCRICT